MDDCRILRRSLLVLVAAAIVLVRAPLHADDLVLTRFGDYLESLRAQAKIPGLAAVVVGTNDITWERAFGYQNVERSIATRTDTPFPLDTVTQLFTTTLFLRRCVEEGRVSLDDRVAKYFASPPEPNATFRQLLSHTSLVGDGLAFSYRPERLAPVASMIQPCTARPFRASTADMLEQMGMFDSVPGSDAVAIPPVPENTTATARYAGVLNRLATPYAVDGTGRPTASRYPSPTLTAAGGLISTARDLAKFDLQIKRGYLRDSSLVQAWTPPVDRNGKQLPHGLGWFVQSYSGELVVWQFGTGDNASSSMIVMLPRRALTLILLANSDGLSRGFPLALGDVAVSPFAKVFLGIFVR